MTDRGQHLDDFCVRRALVACFVHVVHLRSGACCFALLTLPTGGEAGGFSGHNVNAKPEVGGQTFDAGACKFQHPVGDKALLEYRAAEGDSHVVGAHAPFGHTF